MERVIFLVDMNAFFISCEAARNSELKRCPAAVAGDPKNRSGIILTANYEARKFGVRTTMLIHEARELCPDIKLIPPDHTYYEDMSRKVMALLSEYSPVIEQNSIDEAWMDLTGCEGLFGRPDEIARKIMDDIIKRLDLWCSIGISENKFLSKMASELKKPLGITEVWKKDIKQKIWPLPVGRMYGVGKQTERKLTALAINTIGDIANSDRGMLVKKFGKYGDELYNLANGIDTSPVSQNPVHNSKSIGRSTTLSRDTTDFEYAKNILLSLAEEVGADARRGGYKGRVVSIVIKYSDFNCITRQKSIKPTYLTKEIYDTGVELLSQNWNRQKPVRLLGISLNNIGQETVMQLSIFDGDGQEKVDKKQEALEKTIDSIREKYGTDKILRANMVGINKNAE